MNFGQIVNIVEACTCTMDDGLRMHCFPGDTHPYLQIQGQQRCSLTGEWLHWTGRKWQLSVHMTESEIVGTVFKAWETWFEHELRERFRYKGVQVFDPHRSIQALLQLDGVRDVRN
jgi:hypothetical protein